MRQLIADLGSKATNTTLGLVKGSDDINVLESGELQLDTNYDTVEVNTAANIASITRGAKFKKILGNIVGALRGIDESVAQLNSNKASTNHTHDDRYYTENEINAKLNFTNVGGFTAYYDYNNTNFALALNINEEWSRILNFSDAGMWLTLRHYTGSTFTDTVLWNATFK